MILPLFSTINYLNIYFHKAEEVIDCFGDVFKTLICKTVPHFLEKVHAVAGASLFSSIPTFGNTCSKCKQTTEFLLAYYFDLKAQRQAVLSSYDLLN